MMSGGQRPSSFSSELAVALKPCAVIMPAWPMRRSAWFTVFSEMGFFIVWNAGNTNSLPPEIGGIDRMMVTSPHLVASEMHRKANLVPQLEAVEWTASALADLTGS